MNGFMFFSLLCAMVALRSTFSYSSSDVFSNGTWSLVRTNTSSSPLGIQHALAVVLNHTSTHENNGNHYGNIYNGLNGNGNGVNHNQHDNGNAIQALCRKVCVRGYPCPPECSNLQPWSIVKRRATEWRNRTVNYRSGSYLSLTESFKRNSRRSYGTISMDKGFTKIT